MDESLKGELLNNIILSVKSQEILTKPEERKYFELNDKKVEVNKSIHFNFSLRRSYNMDEYPKYSFSITIDRIPHVFFFKNRKDSGSQYVTTIRISQIDDRYSSWRITDIYSFNSESDDSQEKQKELFKYLMDKHLEEVKRKENEKINIYVKESKKLHSKEVVRDEKLDKLLS